MSIIYSDFILFKNMSFSNVLNLIMGIIFGLLLFATLFSLIITKKIKKTNKNKDIRDISLLTYNKYFVVKKGSKNQIINSISEQIKEVSKISCPSSNYPLYELSINQLLDGILLIQSKLKKVSNQPIFEDIKNIHISTILSLEKYTKPITKIANNKFVKITLKIWNVIKPIINLFNPAFYIKLIISKIAFKEGKKDLVITSLDFIGNTTYEIYNPIENNEMKLIENQQ